jgi:hypothetical protein
MCFSERAPLTFNYSLLTKFSKWNGVVLILISKALLKFSELNFSFYGCYAFITSFIHLSPFGSSFRALTARILHGRQEAIGMMMLILVATL